MTDKLKRELKQRRPFSSVHEEVVLSAVRTADVLVQPFAEVVRGANLSLAQYNILRILRGAGEEALPCGEIAERMVSRDPDLTRLLDRLEGRGFIERMRGTEDRRKVLAKITKDGLQLLANLDEPIRDAAKQALGHMSTARLNELTVLLDEARARAAE
ncbi:MAG TPA: MarR family transcriptional regulator [Thermoanaerobaculia bacterium]|nr:MarR family transcriptional regulator [Thermoanaerobaculia bacterium]